MTDKVAVPNSTPLQARVAQAAKVMRIPEKDLWRHLNAMGIEDNQDGQALLEAETTCEGDARAVIVEGKGTIEVAKPGDIPQLAKVIPFKAGWAILKGKGSNAPSSLGNSTEVAQLIDTLKRVEQRTNEELLQMYKPEASYEVIEELRKRCSDRPCIIFEDDGMVDQKNSLKLLRVSHRQETPSTYTVERTDGTRLVRVHRVGDFPMNFLEECPIHGDTILVEGQCETCQDTWDGIAIADRIIVRVARDAGLIDLEPAKVLDLIERIKKEKGATFLLKGATGLHYRELKEEGKLPILRRRVSRGKSDPLFIHRK